MQFRHSWPLEVILILFHVTQIIGRTTDSTRVTRIEIYAKTIADSSEEEDDDSYYSVKDLKVELVKNLEETVRFTWTAPINDKDNFKQYSYRCDDTKSDMYDKLFFLTSDAPRDIKPGRIQSFETTIWLGSNKKVYCALRTNYKKSLLYTRSYLSNIVTVTRRNDSSLYTTPIMLSLILPILCVCGIFLAILLYVRYRRRGSRLQASRRIIVPPGQGPTASQPNVCHWPEQSQQHPTSIENRPPPYQEFENSSHKLASPNNNSEPTNQVCAPNTIGNAEYPQRYEYGPPPAYEECTNHAYQPGDPTERKS